VKRRVPVLPLGAILFLSLLLAVLLSVAEGRTGALSLETCSRGLLSLLGLDRPLPGTLQAIIELRFYRALTAAGVGAALGLSGALLQGVFRNSLAAPSIIGVSSGASLGAAAAILILGGHGPAGLLQQAGLLPPVLVALSSFVCAILATLLVILLATSGGRISVPALLLTGIAVNASLVGLLAALQAVALKDYETARAILAWSFGSLDDMSGSQVSLIWGAVGLALLMIPLVARELDLFAAGEEDARSLGVHTGQVKALAIGGATLVAATAVSVAGQIAFIGLVVPHMVRLMVGHSHRRLLPFCVLFGALFLVGAELLQLVFLGRSALQPGVLMSMIGGPFFVVLLVKQRKALWSW